MGPASNTTSAEPIATKSTRGRLRLDVGSGLIRLITLLVYLFLYLPIAVIVLMSFYPGTYMTFPLPGYSLRWYAEFFQDDLLIRALLNSIGLGATAAILSALLILLNAINLPKGYVYLVIGHIVLTLPYIVITVSSQLYGFPRELEEAALSLGANEIQTFFEITLPLIAPSIFAGMLFAFTVSFQEFVATQAWATPSTYTLPIRIFGRIRDALTPEINVVGVLTVALSLGVATFVQIMSRRGKGGTPYGA
jgi:spermidine/putrescine transport system permease protein